jgi:hypothetical protein
VHPSKLLFIATLLLVAACESPDIHAIPEKLPIVAPPAPRQIETQPVNIQVVTRENIVQIQKEVAGNQDTVFLVLTPRDYENLMANLAEVQRYIRQQKAVITYYVTIVQGEPPAEAAPSSDSNKPTVPVASPSAPVPGSKPVPRPRTVR